MRAHYLFSKYIGHRLIDFRNRHDWRAIMGEYLKTQWLGREKIRQFRWEKFKHLIRHAEEKVPYYRRLFAEHGIRPRDIKDERDITKIPTLDKNTIQENFSDLISEDAARNKQSIFLNSSGGSTGVALNFYQDKFYDAHRAACVRRANIWAGWRCGKPMAYLWGEPIKKKPTEAFRDAMQNFLKNQVFFNAFKIDEEDMRKFLCVITKQKPDVLMGYASSLYTFFLFLKKKNLKLDFLKSIISSSESLDIRRKEFIESYAGCRVFDRYGGRELGLVAQDCDKHEGLHLNMETVLDESESDLIYESPRELIFTNLINYTMPLIRYKVGDVGVFTKKSCSCGRETVMLSSIKGRLSDIFTTKNGSFVHGEYFTHVFYGKKAVKKFQCIQNSVDDFLLKIEVGSDFNKETRIKIEQEIKGILGEDVNITTEIVNEILPTQSGKYLFTKSKVPVRIK